MRWQKAARFVIGVFAIAFAGFVFQALRKSGSVPAKPETLKIDNDTTQYLSIDEQVKHGISEDPYWFVRDKGKP